MPVSEAKKAWDKDNTSFIGLKLNNHTDADILQKLAQVDSKQGYIKALIRRDLEKEKQQQH